MHTVNAFYLFRGTILTIAQFGDVSDSKGANAGGHYLGPWGEDASHACENVEMRHAGDMVRIAA